MKVTSILAYAMLLAGATMAAPVADEEVGAPLEAREAAADVTELEKRDGHINVARWSTHFCNGNKNGVISVGTGGKCVNSASAGSIHIGDASNSNGCKRIHAHFFLGTDCKGDPGIEATYKHNTCHSLAPNQNSAMMKCVA